MCSNSNSGTTSDRLAFLERQKTLLDNCYRGEVPIDVDIQENMLVELIQQDDEKNSGLQAYLRYMMQVMEFDAKRRGRLISQAELNEYTRWLAIAVTEAMHYFIGHGDITPRNETRILAVSAAHIIHMLRDTFDDVQAGYFNIPQEVLDTNALGPRDVQSEAYRVWVKSRIQLARGYFEAGKGYFARIRNLRHRFAGLAYISRFEWLLEAIEGESFLLRPEYNERKSLGTALKMCWLTIVSMINSSGGSASSHTIAARQPGKS